MRRPPRLWILAARCLTCSPAFALMRLDINNDAPRVGDGVPRTLCGVIWKSVLYALTNGERHAHQENHFRGDIVYGSAVENATAWAWEKSARPWIDASHTHVNVWVHGSRERGCMAQVGSA